ncbi:MAG: nucleoside/nucleotide kinase family protein [Nocardioides sp.]
MTSLAALLTAAGVWPLSDAAARHSGGTEVRRSAVRPRTARRLLGITGAPGAGKSTFAAALADLVPGAHVVPMDGFHLADAELNRRGLLERKGTPETFDAWGYAALLARLRAGPRHTVLAPAFDRQLEQPLAGAIAIPPAASWILTEGNYLLLDEPAWTAVRRELDIVWHIQVDAELRRDRLVTRHVRFGKTPPQARAWVDRVDEPNARRVDAAAERADVVLDLTVWIPGDHGG